MFLTIVSLLPTGLTFDLKFAFTNSEIWEGVVATIRVASGSSVGDALHSLIFRSQSARFHWLVDSRSFSESPTPSRWLATLKEYSFNF